MIENVIPTVGILIFNNDKVLLVKHGEKASHLTGTYGLPAGRIEDGETDLETAIRELKEETGFTTLKENLVELPSKIPIAKIKRKGRVTIKMSIKVFLCKKYSGVLKSSEETVPEWIKISDLNKYNLLPNLELTVQKGLEYIKNS